MSETYKWKEIEKPKTRLKIAFVGKSKEANTYCARYLWKKYKFRFYGLDDEMDKFLRRLHNSKYKFRPHINYQIKLRYYDAWYKLDPDIWIRHILYRINEPRATRNAVVPDARYMNEIKALEENGFTIVRVTVAEKWYSKKNTSIKMLNDTVNPGAIDYYEWFSPHVNTMIKARYSVHFETYAGLNRALDTILTELTTENESAILLETENSGIAEVKDGKEKIGALDAHTN